MDSSKFISLLGDDVKEKIRWLAKNVSWIWKEMKPQEKDEKKAEYKEWRSPESQ